MLFLASQYQPLMLIPGYIDPPQIPQIGPEILGRINQLERELRKCCDTIHKSDGVVNDQVGDFLKHYIDVILMALLFFVLLIELIYQLIIIDL